jgi:hypothetical protein
MSTLVETRVLCGVKAIGLDADPNAEGVYSQLGFTTVGRRPRGPFPDGCSRKWNCASTEQQARYNRAAPAMKREANEGWDGRRGRR